MGADVECRQHLPGGILQRHRQRAQAHFQLLIDDDPALVANLGDVLPQGLGRMQGTAGLDLQVGAFEVFVEGCIVQRSQQDTAHGRAVSRQPAAHRQIHRDQPLRRGGTGDIEHLVTLQRGHRTGLVQLFTEAVEDRLRGHRQRCGGQVGVPQRQHLGQQRIGAAVGGDVTELHQRMQAAAHGGAGDFGAVADLRDGEVTLALLERMDHRQATGQRRHEVGIAGQCLDALGRRSDDWRCHRWLENARFVGHGGNPGQLM